MKGPGLLSSRPIEQVNGAVETAADVQKGQVLDQWHAIRLFLSLLFIGHVDKPSFCNQEYSKQNQIFKNVAHTSIRDLIES